MVSIPEYDPNLIPTQFGRLNGDPNKPPLNRSTQELYPPGSTFKVVTGGRGAGYRQGDPENHHRRLLAEGDQRQRRSRTPAARASGRSASRTR